MQEDIKIEYPDPLAEQGMAYFTAVDLQNGCQKHIMFQQRYATEPKLLVSACASSPKGGYQVSIKHENYDLTTSGFTLRLLPQQVEGNIRLHWMAFGFSVPHG